MGADTSYLLSSLDCPCNSDTACHALFRAHCLCLSGGLLLVGAMSLQVPLLAAVHQRRTEPWVRHQPCGLPRLHLPAAH